MARDWPRVAKMPVAVLSDQNWALKTFFSFPSIRNAIATCQITGIIAKNISSAGNISSYPLLHRIFINLFSSNINPVKLLCDSERKLEADRAVARSLCLSLLS
jgi:hypothetical protein